MAKTKITAGANVAPAIKKASKESAKRAAEIAEQHGINTVYENPKGEFFTSENLAMLSVGNDKAQLTTHRPALIKGPVAETIPDDESSDGSEEGEGSEGGANGEGNTPAAE